MWQGGQPQASWTWPNYNMNYAAATGPPVNNEDWAVRAAMWAQQRQFQEQYNAQQQAMAPPSIPPQGENPPLPPVDIQHPAPPDNPNLLSDHGQFQRDQQIHSPNRSHIQEANKPYHSPHQLEQRHLEENQFIHRRNDDHPSRPHDNNEYHHTSTEEIRRNDKHLDNQRHHSNDGHHHHNIHPEVHQITMDHQHGLHQQPQFINENQGSPFGQFGPPVRPVVMDAPPRFDSPQGQMQPNVPPQMFEYNHSVNHPRPIAPQHQYPFPGQEYGAPQMISGEMDAMKKKMLPQWLREGLEKMEKDKTKKDPKESSNTPSSSKISGYEHEPDLSPNASPERTPQASPRASPEGEDILSDKDEEETKPLHRDRNVDSSDPENYMDEEEKEKLLLLKIKWVITDVLMSVTASEIGIVAQEVCNQAKEKAAAKSKQLHSSGGLDALRMGFGEGSSSEEEESGKEDETPANVKHGRFFEGVASVRRDNESDQSLDQPSDLKHRAEARPSRDYVVSSGSDSERTSKKRSKSKHSSKRKTRSPSPAKRAKRSKRKSHGYDSSSSDTKHNRSRSDKRRKKRKHHRERTSSSSNDSNSDDSSTTSYESSSDTNSSTDEEKYQRRHSKSKSKKRGRDKKDKEQYHSEKRGKKHRKHKSKSSRSDSPHRRHR